MLLLLKTVAFKYRPPTGHDIIHLYKPRSYDTFQRVADEIRDRIDKKDPEPSSVDTILMDITFGFYAIPHRGGKKGFHIPGCSNMTRKKLYGDESWDFMELSLFPQFYLNGPVEPVEPQVSGDYPSGTLPSFLHEVCNGKRNKLYKMLPDLIMYVRRAAELRARFMLREGYA